METLAELEKYLEDNCYSFHELSIGKHGGNEGIILEESGGKFNYAYSERGNRRIIHSFDTERELVKYALRMLMKDDWANAHLVAMTYDSDEIILAEDDLVAMNIRFRRNDIPNYMHGQAAYRIFAFGRDILKLEYFKKRYLHNLR